MTNEPNFQNNFELRPEARPVVWDLLTKSQRSAFESIVKYLNFAIRTLPSATMHPTDTRPASGRVGLDERRSNHTVMLSGGRGTGKTSLFLSLRQLLNPCLSDQQRTSPKMQPGFATELSKLSKRIVWLETLDLEPLPQRASLLSAIMARIESAVQDEHGNWPSYDLLSLTETRNGLDKAFFEFERLANDVAIAWEEGPELTATTIDELEIHARDARVAERARLSLRPRFDEVMDLFAEHVVWKNHVRDPIFILPVDDLDLNPRRCLELLRILRGLSTNRLFPLVLGDVNIARIVVELRMQAELSALQKGSRLAPDQLSELQRQSLSLAAEAIRKLLPPPQRLYLKPLTFDEAMEFKPPFDDSEWVKQPMPKFWEILNRVQFVVQPIDGHEPLEEKVTKKTSLQELVSGATDASWPRQRVAYSGKLALQGTVRELTDRWTALSQLVVDDENKVEPSSVEPVLQLFWRELYSKLLGEERLPEAWRQVLRNEELEELQRFPPFPALSRMQVSESRSQSFPYPDLVCKTYNFDGVSVTNGAEGSKLFELEERSRCSFVLFHDLLKRSGWRIESRPILPSFHTDNLIRLERSLLDERLSVVWQPPPFLTFLDLEWFGAWWNELLFQVTNAGKFEYPELGVLATYWMSASFALATQDAADWQRVYKFVSQPSDWEVSKTKVVAEILQRFREMQTDQPLDSKVVVERWALSLGAFLAPENAVPDWIARQIVEDEDHPIASIWRKQAKAIQAERLKVRTSSSDFLTHLLLNPRSFEERCVRFFEQAPNLVRRSENFPAIKQLAEDSSVKSELNLSELRESLRKLIGISRQSVGGIRAKNAYKKNLDGARGKLRNAITILQRFEAPDRQQTLYRQPEISDTIQLLTLIQNFCRKLQDGYQVNADSASHPINKFVDGILCPVIAYDEPLS